MRIFLGLWTRMHSFNTYLSIWVWTLPGNGDTVANKEDTISAFKKPEF
jgi:hypothetical protein